MLSFRPGQKLENEFRILQGTLVESYTNIENLSPEEAKSLHRFALISNIGASTLGQKDGGTSVLFIYLDIKFAGLSHKTTM